MSIKDALNGDELAELLEITPRTVLNWYKAGWLVRVGRRYDVTQSIRSLIKALLAQARGRSSDGGLVKANVAARGRLAAAQARAVELKNQKAEGILLLASDVEQRWSGVTGTLCARMLALSARVGMRLPHLTPFDLSEIDLEVREVLSELSEPRNDPGRAIKGYQDVTGRA
jgi:phage terminase Nu1 subunit (DNA packaging protein)